MIKKLVGKNEFINNISRSLYYFILNPIWIFRLLGIGRTQKTADDRLVLLAPPGAGNIGDQALVEAYLERFQEHNILLLVKRKDDFDLSRFSNIRIESVVVPNLIYGTSRKRFFDVLKLKKILKGCKQFDIVGADIIDGQYNYIASLARIGCAILGAKMGLHVSILGFSWSYDKYGIIEKNLEIATNYGVILNLRDELSYERVSKFNKKNIRCVSDMVFSSNNAQYVESMEVGFDVASLGKNFIIINTSALVESKSNGWLNYRLIINHLMEKGYSIVLLPHVARPGGDDISLSQEVIKMFSTQTKVFLINRILTPSKVRWLCSKSEFIITGRMHLAVIGLGQKKPCVVISTQGKVEGLLAKFDLERFAVDISPNMTQDIILRCDEIIANRNKIVDCISFNLDRVKAESQLNFAHIEINSKI
ncbi:polysaccharide pyruvyl transferase family protein [Limnobacter sp. MED105]|uniref:polysaccharide pyruvyl transferase family protein n=1 Tax=Limnobacter sp. MED105 TaxID=391597 RepID=UPI000156C4F3|nr:polysaccharide pyruvyl transferase family protein [Limnobacter sp. MED105]EDM85036.1 hypothetical protein LMED105_05787 [Limnobacter sp. MED105]